MFRSGTVADPQGHRGAKTRRRGGGRLFAPDARADVPAGLFRSGAEPLPVRDGQPARALLVGARKRRTHDCESDRHRSRAGRESETQQAVEADRSADYQEGAGDRRRHRRNTGCAGYRQLRSSSDLGRERAVDRRPHVAVVGDVPDARLFAVYPDAADGGGRATPEHQAVHLCRTRTSGRVYRQFQGDDPVESQKRRRKDLYRLRPVYDQMPAKADPERIQCRTRPSHGDLRPVPAGRAEQTGDRQKALQLLQTRQVQDMREDLPYRGDLFRQGR